MRLFFIQGANNDYLAVGLEKNREQLFSIFYKIYLCTCLYILLRISSIQALTIQDYSYLRSVSILNQKTLNNTKSSVTSKIKVLNEAVQYFKSS